MLWLTAIGCLAIGVCIGIFASSRMKNAGSARIIALEEQVQDLQAQHARYRDNVGQHFSMTAELVEQMTESYRDVYQHLATGAQDLCSGDVANKLLPAGEDTVLGASSSITGPQAPKDYATRPDTAKAGTLSEEFGIEKQNAERRLESLKEPAES